MHNRIARLASAGSKRLLHISQSKGQLIDAYLHHHPERHVAWIEDGFSTATTAWAAHHPQVRLVDTTQEPLRSFLLTHHVDLAQAVETFLITSLFPTQARSDRAAREMQRDLLT